MTNTFEPLFCTGSTSSSIICIVVKCTAYHVGPVKTVKAKQLHYHTEYCAYNLYYVTSQEWPGLFNALQTDLSDSKESNEKLNKELLDLEAKLSTCSNQTQDKIKLLQVRHIHII